MAVPFWQPGTSYSPDELVQANEAGAITQVDLTNADFEGGATGWALGAGATVDAAGGPFEGLLGLTMPPGGALGLPGLTTSTNSDRHAVTPGQTVRVRCLAYSNIAGFAPAGAAIGVSYYNSGGTLISTTYGIPANSKNGSTTDYREITAEAVAPADAATVSVTCKSETTADSGFDVAYFDKIEWDYFLQSPLLTLNFKATQAAAAFSGVSEPVWPTVVGNTVVDNGVTWEAVEANVIIWKAVSILKSGATEPTFPAVHEATVLDNTILWQAEALRVQDANCPNTKEVAIVASKIFAADKDIIPYSATVNPLDWTTENDAGFIPFGLNTYGAQDVAALGVYRSNLVAFNSKAFQMWQVDEDPANFAILDAIPVGCTHYKSAAPVQNDLVFLTPQGIRSMGISGASGNLQAGLFGKQIDPLVLEAIKGGEEPNALFYPGAGQYWLFFGEEAFVLTMNGGKRDMSWSRYVFPSAIDDWTISSSDLYLRSGDKVWKVDEDTLIDDSGGANVTFNGQIWWPYLDFGALGQTKQLIGFDTVAKGEYSVVFGYNQADDTHVTTSYTITDGDTVPGDIIPMPLAAPSIQIRLTFTGNTAWEWSATSLYLQDWRRTS